LSGPAAFILLLKISQEYLEQEAAYVQHVAGIGEDTSFMINLYRPFADLLIEASFTDPVIELDELVAFILVTGIFDILLDLVASRIEMRPVWF